MFNPNDCNFMVYEKLILDILKTGKYMDFKQAQTRNEFIVLRHDIEFSIDRAYALSKIETKCSFYTSYFVQITNNFYNALSAKNVDLLKKIIKGGHKVGLHYHRNGAQDLELIKHEIIEQSRFLSNILQHPVDRFSFHRPTSEHLKADLAIDGMINTYSKNFFVYTEDPTTNEELFVKYIADSNHKWRYGIPEPVAYQKHQRVHILVHPLSWTPLGENHLDCFKKILTEKHEEMIDTIESEWKYFNLLRGKL